MRVAADEEEQLPAAHGEDEKAKCEEKRKRRQQKYMSMRKHRKNNQK